MVMEKTTFKQRLEVCVSQVGGVLPLATRSGVSRAQLHRYIRGGSEPSIQKVAAIAKAAGVKTGWLVSGEAYSIEENKHVLINHDLFLEVIEKVETAIQVRGLSIPPKRKALLLLFITKAAEEAQEKERALLLSETSIFEMMDFVRAISNDKDLNFLLEGMGGACSGWDVEKIRAWEKLFCQAHIAFYDTLSGQNYFNRLSSIEGPLTEVIENTLKKAQELCPRMHKILDLGCGSGRYLAFFHKYNPQWELCGVDASFIAAQSCRGLESQGVIPEGTFCQADMRNLPFADHNFDFIFMQNSLFSIPYFVGYTGGLNALFARLYKILKPGGVLHGATRYGEGISFYTGQQLLNEDALKTLANDNGLVLMGYQHLDINERLFADMPEKKVPEGFAKHIVFDMVKPLNYKI